MNEPTIKAIVDEISGEVIGRAPGKLFQLTSLSLAIDFRLPDSRYLMVSVEPAHARVHLIQRRVRDLEKQSLPPAPFLLSLRKELSGTTLRSVEKEPGDRIIRFAFAGRDELGADQKRTLIAQITGRTANLFLLASDNTIVTALRSLRGDPSTGEKYEPPRGLSQTVREGSEKIESGKFNSLSEALDVHYQTIAGEQAFNTRATSLRARLQKDLTRAEKLQQRLRDDLAGHGNAAEQKRLGDLLLANLTTARRDGSRVTLIDYFAENAPTIEIETDEDSTLQEEAARRFASYSRSKRAVEKIKERLAGVEKELIGLADRLSKLDAIIADRNEPELETFAATSARTPTAGRSVPPASPGGSKRKPEKKIPGVRRYISSDGYEILVGREARDNDYLTFKVAKPNDLWLHAADYGGSHVVVRNATRKEVPRRTIIEAAQLAAQFSQARKDPKVDVHYTERKFVSKPKGSAPGLVRLMRSKNILVEPKEAAERI